jgi:hypothetical protein
MDRIEEEALRWVFLYQPVTRRDEPRFPQSAVTDVPFETVATGAGPERRPDPVSTFGKARTPARNLTFSSSTDAPTKAFAASGASPESLQRLELRHQARDPGSETDGAGVRHARCMGCLAKASKKSVPAPPDRTPHEAVRSRSPHGGFRPAAARRGSPG